MTQAKRQDIQILRAVAIIAVVLIHTCPNGIYQVWCRPFVNFAVALFFFLSGYLTRTSYDSWTAFFQRRVTRVLIPYLIWTIIYSWAVLPDPMSLISNFVTSNAAAHLYYIPVYIQFVLLTPLIVKLARSRYRHLGWLITPLSLLIFYYPQYFAGKTLNGYLTMVNDISCLNWFTFYYLGIILGNKIITPKFSFKNTGVLLLISIILQVIEGYALYKLDLNNSGTQLKLTSLLTSSLTCMLAYTLLVEQKIQIKNQLLLTIGKYSFGIYLSHILFNRIAKEFAVYHSIPYIINTMIILTVSLLFCLLCDKVLGPRICRWIGIK